MRAMVGKRLEFRAFSGLSRKQDCRYISTDLEGKIEENFVETIGLLSMGKNVMLRLSDCCHLGVFERLRLSFCCQIGL